MANQQKGNKVELSTFLSWGKQYEIGRQTQIENSKTYVTCSLTFSLVNMMDCTRWHMLCYVKHIACELFHIHLFLPKTDWIAVVSVDAYLFLTFSDCLSPWRYRNRCFVVVFCCLVVRRPNLEVAAKRLLHQQVKIPG